jgi:hypothetical protein
MGVKSRIIAGYDEFYEYGQQIIVKKDLPKSGIKQIVVFDKEDGFRLYENTWKDRGLEVCNNIDTNYASVLKVGSFGVSQVMFIKIRKYWRALEYGSVGLYSNNRKKKKFFVLPQIREGGQYLLHVGSNWENKITAGIYCDGEKSEEIEFKADVREANVLKILMQNRNIHIMIEGGTRSDWSKQYEFGKISKTGELKIFPAEQIAESEKRRKGMVNVGAAFGNAYSEGLTYEDLEFTRLR